MNKPNKRERKMHRAARKAPTWLRTIAAIPFDPRGKAEYRTRQLGTFGAASEVRQIDPSTVKP